MSDIGRFADRMARMSTALEEASRKGVEAAALELTQRARKNIAVASGGDNRLSGVGKRGAKVSARYDIKGTKNPTALVRANGPLHLVERDTKPHEIDATRTRTGRRRRSGKKALSTPYGPKAKVRHPGTRGKHPWQRAVDQTLPHTPHIFSAEINAAMKKLFR